VAATGRAVRTGEPCGVGLTAGRALRAADGVAAGRVAAGVARGVPLCFGRALGLASAGASVTGSSVGCSCGVDVASATPPVCAPRFQTTESPAPMTNPRIKMPRMIGTTGSDGSLPFGGVRRDLRGGDSCMSRSVSRKEDAMLSAKRRRVIRVPVPIDVGTIAETASCVFALATPICVERLLALAVLEALGGRAPQDKRERGIRTTLSGFAAGKFVVDVDGRIYDRPEAVVVCSGYAKLRFFSTEAYRERAEAI